MAKIEKPVIETEEECLEGLDERQKLADSCYKKMGWENFKKTWNNAALETIESFKYKNSAIEEFI